MSAGEAELTVLRPRRGWGPLELGEAWRQRELAWMLALREVRVRYKQTLLGATWAVIQPLATMVVFTALFSVLLGRDRMPTTPGVPYAVSTYCALVPWQLFAVALVGASGSLVANQALVTKVYFPRLLLPAAPALAALVDFALALAVLLGMAVVAGLPLGPALLTLPLWTALALASAYAVALWLSALNALYRDVQHAVPFLVQLWMFATPVVYTTASVLGGRADWLRALYAANPMVAVVEGFRFALLGGPAPWGALAVGLAVLAPVLVGGLYVFKRLERAFADVV